MLGGIGVLLILVIADLAWAGVQAADSFSQARDDLRDGGAALEAGQLDEAQNLFGAAGSAGHDAVSALGHPSIGLVGLVPGLSENVDALRRSAKAIEFASAGGTAFAQAGDAAGWDGSTIPGFAPGGHIDASIIEAAGPQLQEAATQLGMARDEVAPIDPALARRPVAGSDRSRRRPRSTIGRSKRGSRPGWRSSSPPSWGRRVRRTTSWSR